MATTETAAADSKTIMKGTTEQNKIDSRDERIIKTQQVLFCCVLISCFCFCCSHKGVHRQKQHSQ